MDNQMKLIKDLGMKFPRETSKTKRRYGLYECPICKKHFKVITASIKNGNTTKCKSCAISIKNTTHSGKGTRLYNIWSLIKSRCYNKKNKNYKDYGGRGVTICKEWQKDYKAFRDWSLKNGYKDNLSIDRIDNNGNYEPNNCRWTTQTIQARNTRKIRSDNTSGFRGVYWNKANKKFMSRIRVNGKRIYLGSFDTAIEAGKAYDGYVIKNNLEHTLNFEINK